MIASESLIIMSLHFSLYLICLVIHNGFTTNAQNIALFDQIYAKNWGYDHVSVLDRGREVQIKIDASSGGGIKSKQAYQYGIFSLKIKVPQRASGIATTFYLTSAPDNGPAGVHAELDFELLGHNGPPYTLNTNVFAQDNGNREQQFKLWFDPTLDFHEYKLIWNQHQIVFFIDGIPIRIYQNYVKDGAKYPTVAMHAHATLWNGTQWLGPTDWSKGPFYASFREFKMNGCPYRTKCDSSKYQWKPSPRELEMYRDIRSNKIKYDYCKSNRGSNFPECKH